MKAQQHNTEKKGGGGAKAKTGGIHGGIEGAKSAVYGFVNREREQGCCCKASQAELRRRRQGAE